MVELHIITGSFVHPALIEPKQAATQESCRHGRKTATTFHLSYRC